ncbi:MAG: hypothetical protein IBJ11_04085 [Phycisphaerales bacterium]|nr:hypothetical protein [Phycisphaerales bacterium]
MRRRLPSPRATLVIAAAALLALALLPARFTGWVGWFRGPFLAAVGPVSGPLRIVSKFLRPGERGPGRPVTDSEAELVRQRDDAERRANELAAQVLELNRLLSDFQRQPVALGSRVRMIEGSVLASQPGRGLVDVARGTTHGIGPGTVVVARGAAAGGQLVGIVTDRSAVSSVVHLITDRRVSPPLMIGVIGGEGVMTPEVLQQSPRVQLKPTGEGLLAADAVGVAEAARIAPGAVVRLLDDSWPVSAQMTLLGRVTAVEPTDNPLFRRVVVRPEVDVARVRSVILRIPADGAPGPGGTP